jgi:hypothetical protein
VIILLTLGVSRLAGSAVEPLSALEPRLGRLLERERPAAAKAARRRGLPRRGTLLAAPPAHTPNEEKEVLKMAKQRAKSGEPAKQVAIVPATRDTTLASQPSGDMRESSQPPPPESASLAGRHHDAKNDSEFRECP